MAPESDFGDRARDVLTLLARRPGYLAGTLARAADDPSAWVLVTDWRDVGSYRRALGSSEVKLAATPLLAQALDLPGAFERLVDVAPGGAAVTHPSDRAERA